MPAVSRRKAEAPRPELHRDGVVGVTDHVPAWTIAALGKYGVATRDILFRMDGIDFVFNFVALGRDGKKPDAMNGAGGRS